MKTNQDPSSAHVPHKDEVSSDSNSVPHKDEDSSAQGPHKDKGKGVAGDEKYRVIDFTPVNIPVDSSSWAQPTGASVIRSLPPITKEEDEPNSAEENELTHAEEITEEEEEPNSAEENELTHVEEENELTHVEEENELTHVEEEDERTLATQANMVVQNWDSYLQMVGVVMTDYRESIALLVAGFTFSLPFLPCELRWICAVLIVGALVFVCTLFGFGCRDLSSLLDLVSTTHQDAVGNGADLALRLRATLRTYYVRMTLILVVSLFWICLTGYAFVFYKCAKKNNAFLSWLTSSIFDIDN